MLYNEYVDPNDYKSAKKKAKKYGMGKSVMPVDMEYGYVPTKVSQKAKGNNANVNMAAYMNKKRFGYDNY